MTRLWMGLALGMGLAACGGTAPFGNTVTGGGGPTTAGSIPEALANDLESFSYDPSAGTLSIRGVSLEDGPFEATYRRRPGLDRGGYQAFTAQDGSLDRHSTAYVRDIRGARAAIAVTGGQFTYFFAGGAYGSDDFVSPVQPGATGDGGLVSYAGTYVGLLNTQGSGEDLDPVTPGTPPSFTPTQAGEITGRILINASFADGTVNGTITDRRADIAGQPQYGVAGGVEDLDLAPAPIAADGTFFGDSSVGNQTRGEYGGIFGGNGATEVAGVVHATSHITGLNEIEEYGAFVLAQCGTAQADPVCTQPVP